MEGAIPGKIKYPDITLTLSPNEIYIEFSPEFSKAQVVSFMERHDLRPVQVKSLVDFNQTDSNRRWFELGRETKLQTLLEELLAEDHIQIASPVYHRADLSKKTALTFSSFVLVKPKSRLARNLDELEMLAKKFGQIVSEPIDSSVACPLYRIRISDPKTNNALEVSTKIAESPLVEDSHPDWISLTSVISTIPNDTYLEQQWALPRIRAFEGWELSKGSRDVVICVIDSGCDLVHEDLAVKYVPGFNATDGTTPPDDDEKVPHGTWCAGLAAAQSDNRLGVAGLAWECKIMPIKIIDKTGSTTESIIHDAIRWAINNDADVISMSWNWAGTHRNIDCILNLAAQNNIIMVAAAGNENKEMIDYPACYPPVMAIGATDQLNHRKTPLSPDAQCWGSNYGTQLSVMAPGVYLWTTDLTGCGAQKKSNNNGGGIQGGDISVYYCINSPPSPPCCGSKDCNYWSQMGGTSGATAYVAGLAALVVSQHPTITCKQARKIIEKTAQRVGGYNYTNGPTHPNGRWNKQMGYGLIDIRGALSFSGRRVIKSKKSVTRIARSKKRSR